MSGHVASAQMLCVELRLLSHLFGEASLYVLHIALHKVKCDYLYVNWNVHGSFLLAHSMHFVCKQKLLWIPVDVVCVRARLYELESMLSCGFSTASMRIVKTAIELAKDETRQLSGDVWHDTIVFLSNI